jgi:hypothetical protein
MAEESARETLPEESHLFFILVSQLRDAAWLGLGKVPHPVSGKVERDLDIARMHIDMLGMLSSRMEGRLHEVEDRFLQETLTQLRLMYVEELKRSPSAPGAESPPEAEAGSPGPPAGEKPHPAEDGAGEKSHEEG